MYAKNLTIPVKVAEEIAKEHLRIDTLKTQFSDGLDFHDCSAASILDALNAAYKAGKKAKKPVKKVGTPWNTTAWS